MVKSVYQKNCLILFFLLLLTNPLSIHGVIPADVLEQTLASWLEQPLPELVHMHCSACQIKLRCEQCFLRGKELKRRAFCASCSLKTMCRTCADCDTIYFNTVVDGEGLVSHHPFSNLAMLQDSVPLVIDEQSYASAEHYFQWCRCADEDVKNQIRGASTPVKAWMLGRDCLLESLSTDAQVAFMKKALFAKFTQSAVLQGQLLATAQARLVYRIDADALWGDGVDGKGKNFLGLLLCELRGMIVSMT